jgi:hypothetical protein
MNDEKSFSLINIDTEAFSYSLKKGIDGVSSFLGKVCMPAAEEFGLLSRDKVHAWRLMNIVNIVENSKGILAFDPNTFELKISPRIVWKILENGSWAEDKNLQNMWAGLLASSCTKNGKDESNLIYVDILSRITPSEAYIINYVGKRCSESTGLVSKYFNTLININNELFSESVYFEDLDHLERELNHLESLGLIRDLDLVYQHHLVGMAATGLLLDLYVRCNGSLLSTNNYFAQFWESNRNKF